MRASRGIIFAVLPIQLCVRRKAAFNKSLIKGKQRGVSSAVLSRCPRIFRSCAREIVLLLFSPPAVLPRRDYRENRPVGPLKKRRNTRKERDSRKDRSCHAPIAPPKSTDSSLSFRISVSLIHAAEWAAGCVLRNKKKLRSERMNKRVFLVIARDAFEQSLSSIISFKSRNWIKTVHYTNQAFTKFNLIYIIRRVIITL